MPIAVAILPATGMRQMTSRATIRGMPGALSMSRIPSDRPPKWLETARIG